MSLNRLILYSAIIGGLSAFLGWMVAEPNEVRIEWGLKSAPPATCILVGAAIGAGLNVVAAMAYGRSNELIKLVVQGVVAGALGGFDGWFIGLFCAFFPAMSWMVTGAFVGVGEGAFEKSRDRTRNGLIGGALGGLVGGLLYDPIQNAIHSQSGMGSRATAFVI